MRLLARLLFALALLAGPAASAAQAVTLKDLVDLKKAGISDAVLVALIDSDGTVFQLTATEVRMLRDAGFSDSLIISVLNTAVQSRAQMDAQAQVTQQMWAAQAQQPTQIWNTPAPTDTAAPVPMWGEPTIPLGVVIAAPIVSPDYRYYRQAAPRFVPPQTPVYVAAPAVKPAPKVAPVYWGFGGQLRPDAWKDPGGGR
jgi:hypothetical protein